MYVYRFINIRSIYIYIRMCFTLHGLVLSYNFELCGIFHQPDLARWGRNAYWRRDHHRQWCSRSPMLQRHLDTGQLARFAPSPCSRLFVATLENFLNRLPSFWRGFLLHAFHRNFVAMNAHDMLHLNHVWTLFLGFDRSKILATP